MNANMENLEIDAELEGIAMCNIQQGETFRPIADTDGRYMVSDRGRVYDMHRKRFVRTYPRGVAIVKTDGKRRTTTVARLVAEAFLPNTYNKPYVYHKGDVRDNSCENLFWCSRSEALEMRTPPAGKPHPFVKQKIVGTSIADGSELHYDCMRDAEEDGFRICAISNCVRGRKKQYKGYIWREGANG